VVQKQHTRFESPLASQVQSWSFKWFKLLFFEICTAVEPLTVFRGF
jgi:hypothetical protein